LVELNRPFGTNPSSVLFPTLKRWAILVMSFRDEAPANFRKALGFGEAGGEPRAGGGVTQAVFNDLGQSVRRLPHERRARAINQPPLRDGAMPARPAGRSWRTDGFTLTELLVVIAMIAVLGGLVLSALPMAMRKARDIDCRSHLKQHGLAVLAFLGDHNVYPLVSDNLDVNGERCLFGALTRTLGPRPARTAKGELNFRSVWSCPAGVREELPPDYPKTAGRPGWAYGYNQAGLGQDPLLPRPPLLGLGGTEVNYGWTSSPPVNEPAVVSPSRMICMGDDVAGCSGTFLDATWVLGRRAVADFHGSTQRVKTRHGGKLNILFCDGRVEALTLQSLFSDTNDQALSLWNRDHQPHREMLP
jgi:prepilin-type processing-associated H-X9-DG protein/prepilin-type N-terminal cleavage/methylation domain-containing protein